MSDRLTYILRRLIGALLVVFAVSTLVFVVVRAVPGDPVESILGELANPADKQQLRECLRLDQPLSAQFGLYLRDVADLSLGRLCDNPDITVSDRLVEALPHTVLLALVSVVFALMLSIPLGVMAALKQGGPIDLMALTVALLGVSIPSFWMGPMLLILFTVFLRAFPDPGSGVVGLTSLILPAITLGTALSAKLTRMTRASMLEVLSADYVRTAHSKGLRRRVVIYKHALRNALIPVVTVVGLQFGALLSGAIIVEKIFARPGLGSLLLGAIERRSYMEVQGCVLVIATCYVLVNLLTDLVYTVVDPRIQLEGDQS
ncbi:MAG: ABC transporter permease [Myxococcales bacterium]|nr:ABC transporter permease [Myxococcales bacterium]